MAHNLLDQLHETDVPPPPSQISRGVHVRLNQWLLFAQVMDLVLRAFAYATGHFAAAVLGMVSYSLTGKFSARDGTDRDGNPPM